MTLVLVGGGPFRFGINADWDTIQYDFLIGKYEVTNRQFHAFLTDAISKGVISIEEGRWRTYYPGDSIIPAGSYHVKVPDNRIWLHGGEVMLNDSLADHPVTSVTWFGCMAFCQFYGFDLPTAREWEKAARGPYPCWFPWGDGVDGSFANYFSSGDPYEPGTTPVGFYDGSNRDGFQTSDGSSVYGCHDMAGNAWEWTRDRWAGLPYFIGKGGGFHYHTPAFLQIYYTSTFGPGQPPPLDMCDRPDGFRVVLRMN